jgi:hypothetical protein
MTTAYDLIKKVLRLRKRLSNTSIHGNIVRPVFGDAHEKLLFIPRYINNYNHYINGVDRNN